MNLSASQKEELRRLVAAGQKIVAVKRYREITRVGLKEALHAVEHLFPDGSQVSSSARASGAQENTPKSAPTEKALQNAEAAALAALREGNNIIEAIKRYRKHTGLGLKEARDAVIGVMLTHHSDGRVNAKTSRLITAMLADGRREEAVTQLMMTTGYEDREARDLLKRVQKAGGAASCSGGCLAVLALIALAIAALGFLILQSR
jgi:ribosomal protein L7/L12